MFNITSPTNDLYYATNSRTVLYQAYYSADVLQFDFIVNGVITTVPSSSHSPTGSTAQFLVTLEPGVNRINVRVYVGGWIYLGERIADFTSDTYRPFFEFRPFQIRSEIFQESVIISWYLDRDALPYLKSFNVYRSSDATLEESTFAVVSSVSASEYTEEKYEDVIENKRVVKDDGTVHYIKIVTENAYLRFTALVSFDRNSTDPVFYCVSSVSHFVENNFIYESFLSDIIKCVPFNVPALTPYLPVASRLDLSTDYVTSLLLKYPEEDLKPGTELQDQIIAPLSDFASKQELKLDFCIRGRMFPSLLEIDDANGDGISDAVTSDNYKGRLAAAFNLNETSVQDVIDAQFDALAGNVFVVRKSARPSEGWCLLYAVSLPTKVLKIPAGELQALAPKELTQKDADVLLFSREDLFIDPANSAAKYNPVTRRYEWPVYMETYLTGKGTILRAETVSRMISNPSGVTFGITNLDPIVGGIDEESNSDLASRALLAYVGNDVGTIYGYKKSALGVEEVEDAYIVDATHPLMVRDWDEVRHKHIAGMVDVYVRGIGEEPVTETFSLTPFDVVPMVFNADKVLEGETFFLREVAQISSVLEVVAVNRGSQTYSLVNMVIEDNRKIRLDFNVLQNSNIGWMFGEKVFVKMVQSSSVRYFEPSQKPVLRITTAIKDPGGANVDVLSAISLVSPSPIWWHGYSFLSHDYFKFAPVGGGTSGSLTHKVQLNFVLEPGVWSEPLAVNGIDHTSVVVWDDTYVVPPTFVTVGYDVNGKSIVKVSPSYKVDPFSAKIEYDFYQNVEISYWYNKLVPTVQQKIYEDRRHIDADVLVKMQIPFDIVIRLKVVLSEYTRRREINQEIRDRISEYISSLDMGSVVYGSNIIGIVEEVSGVHYVDLQSDGFKVLILPNQIMPMEYASQPYTLHQTSPDVYKVEMRFTPNVSNVEKLFCYGDGIARTWFDGSGGFSGMPTNSFWMDSATRMLYFNKGLGDRTPDSVYFSYVVNDPREYVDLQAPSTQYFRISSLEIEYSV